MTANPSRDRRQHTAVWLVLPWYVNGKLNLLEWANAWMHLRRCRACRDELALQRRLRTSIRRVPASSPTPIPAFEKFKSRIQADIERSAATAASSSSCRTPAGAWDGLGRCVRSRWVWSAAVGLLALAVLPQMSERGLPLPLNTFRTSASPATPVRFQWNDVRVVFAKPLDAGMIQALLAPLEGRIVDGPNGSGVYTVRFGASGVSREEVAERIGRLRANADVALAEPAIPWDSALQP